MTLRGISETQTTSKGSPKRNLYKGLSAFEVTAPSASAIRRCCHQTKRICCSKSCHQSCAPRGSTDHAQGICRLRRSSARQGGHQNQNCHTDSGHSDTDFNHRYWGPITVARHTVVTQIGAATAPAQNQPGHGQHRFGSRRLLPCRRHAAWSKHNRSFLASHPVFSNCSECQVVSEEHPGRPTRLPEHGGGHTEFISMSTSMPRCWFLAMLRFWVTLCGTWAARLRSVAGLGLVVEPADGVSGVNRAPSTMDLTGIGPTSVELAVGRVGEVLHRVIQTQGTLVV